jgi:hypothetical protein
MKKMDLDKPAVAAAQQAPSNELSELKKLVVDLSKKVDINSKKVRENLYSFLCLCAGHLSLTSQFLNNLVLDTVEAGWEEIRECQGQGEERKVCTNRNQKSQKGKGRSLRCSAQAQKGSEDLAEVKGEGQQEERWQEVSASFGLSFGTDSTMGPVSVYGRGEFSNLYGLDFDLLRTDCRFLCLSFPPSVLLDRRLRLLVQLCCVVISCTTAVPKFNILDYTTYPDCVTLVEQDLLFLVLSRFAPKWLLSCRRFTNVQHHNLEIEVPGKVIGTFSAGQKYISPIAMKKSLVKDSWTEFTDRAYKLWNQCGIEDLEPGFKEKHTDDAFFGTMVPFVLKGEVKPFEGEPHESVQEVLQAGWTEIESLLANVPYLDRNNRSIDVESKDSLEWCYKNKILVKPTDKNLGTALVSTDWYDEKVAAFIETNKGYEFITDAEARIFLRRTVNRIRTLAYYNETTLKFMDELPKFFGSRLPPVRRINDKRIAVDVWEETIISLPIFNGLPKIHKTPWGIRPVIPCHSVVQGPVSEFLSVLLKPLLADHPQILTSTKELVFYLETSLRSKLAGLSWSQWQNNVFICTADIEGFYTNVPIRDCGSKLKDLVLDFYGHDADSREKAEYVSTLFSIQQDDLIFKAKVRGVWEIIRQVDGLAMGMPAAPDIANLFAAWYEKRFPAAFSQRCLLWKRYIDDIICVVLADSLDHCEQVLRDYSIPGLKMNWVISETNSVFLDLDIWRSPFAYDRRLKYRPYRKLMNNFERLPWCTGHSLQLLRGAFKSEVYRFAVSSWCISLFNEEMVWLKDLYISRGYPPATVMNWIQSAKDIAYKNRLDWVPKALRPEEKSERIWPLKSVMNPVWQKLNLGMVNDVMRRSADRLMDEDRDRWRIHCAREGLWFDPLEEHSLAPKFRQWFGRLVGSQKRPFNFGDKENRHNRALLGIQGKHAKFALGGRSVDQREEDELRSNNYHGTLDYWLKTGTLYPREPSLF